MSEGVGANDEPFANNDFCPSYSTIFDKLMVF